MLVKTAIKAGQPLGDQIAVFTHATKLDRLAEAWTDLTGLDCGCERRRQLLNRLFP